MNKREALLNLVRGEASPDYIPAAFFMHFDPAYHTGQAAVDKHLEYFRATGMDFVKIQFEQRMPPEPAINEASDWAHIPLYPESFFEPTVRVVEGLVKAAKDEALVVLTLYSPFMLAMQVARGVDVAQHLRDDPDSVAKGLANMTENELTLVRACMGAGVDGFYTSTQGGETFRFGGENFFEEYIKPTDLAVWNEIEGCTFNILHVCDYAGGYDDYSPFLDYPGHVVNCSLTVGDKHLLPTEAAELFGRPFMGGLERKGVIATGSQEEIRSAVDDVIAHAPERFILAADCTIPSETPWANLKTAIDRAHQHQL
ncbi:MAG: uroporphyrinogen decarboxylase family protein [Caldilineaceae bacterium]